MIFNINIILIHSLFQLETAKEIEREENDDYGWYDRDEHQFFVPERARWTHIQIQTQDIGNTINKAFEALEEENPSFVFRRYPLLALSFDVHT